MQRPYCYLLLITDVLVHGLCSCLTGTHGLDDGGGTGHGIAAGVHGLTGGKALLVDDDTALLVDLQALGGGLDQGVGGGTQRHDDSVHIQLELAALLFDGAAAAGRMLSFHLN